VPLHRLGRWTSGVVLFARTRKARISLSEAWRRGQVGKKYRALVSGKPREQEFTVRTPIGPVPHRGLGTVFAADPEGKTAVSRVTVLQEREDSFLADVVIETGRPHQIRIHLAAAGYPLVGDPLYSPGGRPPRECTALPGDPGYHLHAAELQVPHPETGAVIELRSEPPDPLRVS
jgi:23S rRNA pseudouridine1911/1915/1917 synthase